MGLFGSGKTSEEKHEERVARALDEMGVSVDSLKQPDGKLHVGCFDAGSVLASRRNLSLTVDGVVGFLQDQGREVVDVKLSPGSGESAISQLVTILYR